MADLRNQNKTGVKTPKAHMAHLQPSGLATSLSDKRQRRQPAEARAISCPLQEDHRSVWGSFRSFSCFFFQCVYLSIFLVFSFSMLLYYFSSGFSGFSSFSSLINFVVLLYNYGNNYTC